MRVPAFRRARSAESRESRHCQALASVLLELGARVPSKTTPHVVATGSIQWA